MEALSCDKDIDNRLLVLHFGSAINTTIEKWGALKGRMGDTCSNTSTARHNATLADFDIKCYDSESRGGKMCVIEWGHDWVCVFVALMGFVNFIICLRAEYLSRGLMNGGRTVFAVILSIFVAFFVADLMADVVVFLLNTGPVPADQNWKDPPDVRLIVLAIFIPGLLFVGSAATDILRVKHSHLNIFTSDDDDEEDEEGAAAKKDDAAMAAAGMGEEGGAAGKNSTFLEKLCGCTPFKRYLHLIDFDRLEITQEIYSTIVSFMVRPA